MTLTAKGQSNAVSVLAVADREGAISFDAPGAQYTHRDGLCSFEVLIAEYGIGDDPADRDGAKRRSLRQLIRR